MTTVRKNNYLPVDTDMLIGGKKVGGGERIAVYNPARPDELVGRIVRGTPEDVNLAVAAARDAQPAWGAKSFVDRAAILSRVLDRLEENIEERTALFVRENGKTWAEARGELLGVPARQRLTLEHAQELDGERLLPAPHGRSFVGYKPFGVVVSIVPWNSPVGLAFLQIIPALLAGNSIVLKPPETCPLALIGSVAMAADLLPPGVMNVVSGRSAEIGEILTTHPDVAKVGFTGSVTAASKIMANAAKTIKDVTLELGGNDPAILLPDADLGEAGMQRMADSVFRMTGQVCMAIKRIYVPEAINDRFLTAFGKAVDRIVVGDGLDSHVTMGPMHTAQALKRARGLLANAERHGGTVRELGKIHDIATFEHGHFMRPTIATGVADKALLVTEEQFCPVIPILTYSDIEDAVQRANATIYGLGGSVWSRNIEQAMSLARRLEAGTVFVNTHGTQSVNRQAPYGGVKQSGIGRRAGIEGIREYMQIQTLTTYED